jgi:hypothetical protein
LLGFLLSTPNVEGVKMQERIYFAVGIAVGGFILFGIFLGISAMRSIYSAKSAENEDDEGGIIHELGMRN